MSVDIKARVVVPPPEPHAAFLTAFDDVSGLGAWHRRWFRLQPPRLAFWKYPDDVQKKVCLPPLLYILSLFSISFALFLPLPPSLSNFLTSALIPSFPI